MYIVEKIDKFLNKHHNFYSNYFKKNKVIQEKLEKFKLIKKNVCKHCF